MRCKVKYSFFISAVFFFVSLKSQTVISIDSCYNLLLKNYPLAKQFELLSKENELQTSNIKKVYLPQLSINGQATYQSDVTSVPVKIPGNTIPSPNKDQYKITLDASQVIYDGGYLKKALNVQNYQSAVKNQQLQSNFYQLKNQITQLYFSVLLIDGKFEIISSIKKTLEAKLSDVNSALKNSLTTKGSVSLVKIEIIKLEQQLNELKIDRNNSLAALGDIVGLQFDENTELNRPYNGVAFSSKTRPEVELYKLQSQQLAASEDLLSLKNFPRLFAFGQGGYGNPGLNMLDNNFQTFYIAGLKLNWNFFDWNKTKNEKQIIQINKDITANQLETFELNNKVELKKQSSEIDKLMSAMQTDIEIIALQKEILNESESGLKNGDIKYSDYLSQLNALLQAELTLKLHEVQALKAKQELNYIKGF